MYIFAILFGFLSIYVGYMAIAERQIDVGVGRGGLQFDFTITVVKGWVAVTSGYFIALCGGVIVFFNTGFMLVSLASVPIDYGIAFWFMEIPMMCIILCMMLSYSVQAIVSLWKS